MTAIVVALLAVIAAAVVAALVLQRRAESTQPSLMDRDLTFYQVAYLAGGARRVAETALSYLIWAGLVDVREGARTVALRGAPSKDAELAPVERALVATIPAHGGSPTYALGAAREAARFVEDGLGGLIVPSKLATLVAVTAVAPSLLAGTIAIAVMVALRSRGAPLGFMPVVPVLGLVVALVISVGRSRLTTSGRAALTHLLDLYDSDLNVAAAGVTSLPIERGLYLVALYGRPAMTGGLSGLRRITGSR
jgi:uncharacterized protein (TIGR04222 family)